MEFASRFKLTVQIGFVIVKMLIFNSNAPLKTVEFSKGCSILCQMINKEEYYGSNRCKKRRSQNIL